MFKKVLDKIEHMPDYRQISLRDYELTPEDGLTENQVVRVGNLNTNPVIYLSSHQPGVGANYISGWGLGLRETDIGKEVRLVDVGV